MTTSLDFWSDIQISVVEDTLFLRTPPETAAHAHSIAQLLARLDYLTNPPPEALSPSTRLKCVRKRTVEPTPVYDIENLRGQENFALANGVVVHNSAAGGMRFARFEYFQEFLPLKGKPKNVMRGNAGKNDKTLESEEILNIFAMIGFDPKLENPYEKLRTGKIIIMADGDPDGSHIVTLLCAVFYRFLPDLFRLNKIFVTRVPEFYSIVGKRILAGDTLAEVQALLEKEGLKGTVNHVKGYGEIDSSLLRIFACDPQSRRLYRVQPEGADKFELLMGNDTATRKQLLGI